MLVLSRKPHESFRVGDVTIHIKAFRKGSVQIAIDAPPRVHVVRCELPHLEPKERHARPMATATPS